MTAVTKSDKIQSVGATRKSHRIDPVGRSTRQDLNRLRSTDRRFAELEKKYEVSLAIADLVILHRTRSGLSQAELARKMGTSVPAISRLESGFHTPSLETLRRLAAALGGEVKVQIVPAKSGVAHRT